MNAVNINVAETIESAIASAIKMEIEEAVKAATEKAKAELEKKIPEIVAGIALRVNKQMSIRSFNGGIEIRLMMCNAGG